MGIKVPEKEARRSLGVVICSHDRAETLARTLSSLIEQELPPESITVVDNAPSTQATQTLVSEHFPTVKYILEPTPGLDFARNRALSDVEADVIAFIDDDAIADREWVSKLAGIFNADPQLRACSGMVLPYNLRNEPQQIFQRNGGLTRGKESVTFRRGKTNRRVPLIVAATDVAVGCNMAVDRIYALELGGFDLALDMGKVLPGGGDIDMFWRTVHSSGSAQYLPDAIVYHEHRSSMSGVSAQISGHQKALVAFLCKALFTSKLRYKPTIAAFLIWRLAKPGWRIFRSTFGRDVLPMSILFTMWWSCLAGLYTYPLARRLANQRYAQSNGEN